MWTLFLNILCVRAISPSSWIGESLAYIGDLTLQNITLPGTHDSGSYHLTETILPGEEPAYINELIAVADFFGVNVDEIIRRWALAQDKNFYDQMFEGIRYFDFRSGWDKDTNQWVTYHTVIGYPVEYLLRNISQYLTDFPFEIVVVEMSHFDGDPSDSDILKLQAMVLDTLGQYLYPFDSSFKFTIRQMISSGKRALVTMEKGYNNKTIWTPSVIHNTYADSADVKTMINYNNKTVQEFMAGKDSQKLFKISWTLTPDADTITGSVWPWNPQNLIQLADTANNVLPSFWASIQQNKWRMGNLLIIDHYEKSDIVKITWTMNGIPYSSFRNSIID